MTNLSSTLSSAAEDLITECFYGRVAFSRRSRAYEYGLQAPLWLWGSTGNSKEKELQRLINLCRWLLRNKQGKVSIAVVVLSEWKAAVQQGLCAAMEALNRKHSFSIGTPTSCEPTDPQISIFSQHELSIMLHRDSTRATFDVVVYSVGILPSHSAERFRGQEEWLRDAIRAAEASFILSVDVGWLANAVQARWPQWKLFIEKMESQELPVSVESEERSVTTSQDVLPRLRGKALPLCCSAHPNQKFLEYGVRTIETQCQRFCLRNFSCGEAQHICYDRCHSPGHHFTNCPYRCNKTLPCGHQCLQQCSTTCNCFEIIEKPLSCFHEIPIGLDKESGETVYATVNHNFRGHCVDAHRPCQVQYTTECAQCLGSMKVLCFEATEIGHTLSNKVLVCDSCQHVAKEIRAEILGSMLCETEKSRKRMRTEMIRTIHQQHKAATQGLFSPGERVEIIDSSRCVAPLLEDDFPNISFFSMEDPNYFSTLQGAYGTFISSHVDTVDLTEVRSLVRLPNGLHVLVTDGGLRLLRPSTQHVVNNATLLLTGPPDAKSVKTDGDSTSPEVQKMIGKLFYVTSPVLFSGGGRDRQFSDCLVRVVQDDKLNCNQVIVETILYSTSSALMEETPCHETKTTKETPGEFVPTFESTALPESSLTKTTYRMSSPLSSLESLDGFEKNKKIYITRPEHQIRDTFWLTLLAEISRAEMQDPNITLTASRLQEDTPYKLLLLVNCPYISAEYRSLGPIAIVQGERPRDWSSRSAGRRCHRKIDASTVTPSNTAPGEAVIAPLFAIPYMFTRADDEAEAEAMLDTVARETFHQRLQAALEKKYEDMAYRNDEKSFYQLEQMPPVTPEAIEEKRIATSAPSILPSRQELSAIKQRYMSMPVSSPERTKTVRLQDMIQHRKEIMEFQGKWVQSVSDRINVDFAAEASHISSTQVQLTQRK